MNPIQIRSDSETIRFVFDPIRIQSKMETALLFDLRQIARTNFIGHMSFDKFPLTHFIMTCWNAKTHIRIDPPGPWVSMNAFRSARMRAPSDRGALLRRRVKTPRRRYQKFFRYGNCFFEYKLFPIWKLISIAEIIQIWIWIVRLEEFARAQPGRILNPNDRTHECLNAWTLERLNARTHERPRRREFQYADKQKRRNAETPRRSETQKRAETQRRRDAEKPRRRDAETQSD